MFSRNKLWRGVKVVSASLVESLPAPDKEKPAMHRHATLTFHLQRFRASERFGIDCAFRPFGDSPDQCFVRRMPADLVASSAVLRGVLGSEGRAAHNSAVRVTSINGVTGLSQATVRQLLASGREVVVQCAVSGVAESTAAPDDSAAAAEEEHVVASPAPKRRGRPKATASSAEDEDTAAPVKKRGRRGRRPAGTTLRLSKKRLRYSGARTADVDEAADPFASESPEGKEVDAVNAARAAAAHDVDAAALASLSTLMPVKVLRRRGRPAKKSTEPSPATRSDATPAKGAEDSVWFARTPRVANADTAEAGEGDGKIEEGERVITFASDDSAPRKRRGRPRTVKPAAEEEAKPEELAAEEEEKPKRRRRLLKTASAPAPTSAAAPKRRGRRGSEAQAAVDDSYAAKVAEVKADEAAGEAELEF